MSRDVWYTVAGIGSEGVEMLISSKNRKEVEQTITKMELRARFNSHRRIKLYAYLSPKKVTWDDFKDRNYRAHVLKIGEAKFA